MGRRGSVMIAATLVALAFIGAGVVAWHYHLVQRTLWQINASAWARHAGVAEADNQHGAGVRRFYRLVDVSGGSGPASTFTGEYEDGVEVWGWPAPGPTLDGWEVSANAFVEAFNGRMRRNMAEAATRPAAG